MPEKKKKKEKPKAPTQDRWTGPRVDATVDIAVVSKSKKRILFGHKKKDAEGTHRFIGGYSDAEKDTSFLNTAMRELGEEVLGLMPDKLQPKFFRLIGNTKIRDIRYADRTDIIITTLYIFDYDEYLWSVRSTGSHIFDLPLKGGDDIESVKWFDLYEMSSVLMDHHQPLGKMLFEYLLENK